MRAFLALVAVLIAASPAVAGTWQPRQSFGTYGRVGMGADGTTLIGWPEWNYDLDRSEVRYARVADDGTFGPAIVAAIDTRSQCCAEGRGGVGPTVIDRDGNATLIFGFRDDSDYGGESSCCHRYETALLPRDADKPIRYQRLEPSRRDRTLLQLAVTPGGARIGAWAVVRPRSPARIIQVLDAPAGGRFGRPRAIADEPLQEGTPLEVAAERGRAGWVAWTTEEKTDGGSVTAVRVARRPPFKRRWRLRTIARLTDTDGRGPRISRGSLHMAAGPRGEVLVGWKECDNDPVYPQTSYCQVRSRWRRSGIWAPAQTSTPPGGVPVGDDSWGLALDRRSRALLVFDACKRNDQAFPTTQCAVETAYGRAGQLDPPTELGPGRETQLGANRRGNLMLVYSTGESSTDYERYARAGTVSGGFEASEKLDIYYMTSCCGFSADDEGNFSLTAHGYDGGTYLLRYRR